MESKRILEGINWYKHINCDVFGTATETVWWGVGEPNSSSPHTVFLPARLFAAKPPQWSLLRNSSSAFLFFHSPLLLRRARKGGCSATELQSWQWTPTKFHPKYLQVKSLELVVAFCEFICDLGTKRVEGGIVAFEFAAKVPSFWRVYLLNLRWGQVRKVAWLVAVRPKMSMSSREKLSELSLSGSSSL